MNRSQYIYNLLSSAITANLGTYYPIMDITADLTKVKKGAFINLNDEKFNDVYDESNIQKIGSEVSRDYDIFFQYRVNRSSGTDLITESNDILEKSLLAINSITMPNFYLQTINSQLKYKLSINQFTITDIIPVISDEDLTGIVRISGVVNYDIIYTY